MTTAEAATMDADLADWLGWMRAHGVGFAISGDLVREPDHDGPLIVGVEDVRDHVFDGLEGPVREFRDTAGGRAADHATLSVAAALLAGSVRPGDRVWEIGCGTGVLAVAAARAGAGRVVCTDVDAAMLALAERTTRAAGIAAECRCGSLLEPFGDGERADLVVANLPHKPCPEVGALPLGQAGGPDGTSLHGPVAQGIVRHLAPDGRVLFFLHSLAHPGVLLDWGRRFDLELLRVKRRWLQAGEYGGLEAGFARRAREGVAWMGARGERRFLAAGVWRATLRHD